ncbi:hypothetical protein [Thermosipho sp. 1074]|uniref:hypothetical protein n=1 Tax=Thermosipho sp. 1074 TaxID=1643331 RepID=UPI0009872457|nr:hypothetical protein [Thermosipho sp. 1074]
MKIKFSEAARNIIGVNTIEVNFGTLDEISKQISQKTHKKISFLIENEKTFLLLNDKIKTKVSVIILNNAEIS